MPLYSQTSNKISLSTEPKNMNFTLSGIEADNENTAKLLGLYHILKTTFNMSDDQISQIQYPDELVTSVKTGYKLEIDKNLLLFLLWRSGVAIQTKNFNKIDLNFNLLQPSDYRSILQKLQKTGLPFSTNFITYSLASFALNIDLKSYLQVKEIFLANSLDITDIAGKVVVVMVAS